MASIREIDPQRDAEAAVALLQEASPIAVVTVAAWQHRLATIPGRALARGWVIEDDDGRVVGNSYSFLSFFSEDPTTGLIGLNVAKTHRRRGIGSELHALAVDHVAGIGAKTLLTTFYENDAGVAFATKQGYREVRAERAAVLDPRSVTAKPPREIDLRPVREVDPQLVYRADVEATRDMPTSEPIEVIPYDEWKGHVLEHPLFTADGSFVAIVDGVGAAVSLLLADPESGRATSMFTGTMRGYRGHGLGLAVKLASIDWAAANRITTMTTTNDERNAPMLAVNRKLGYAPAGRRVEYLRDLG